MNIGERIKQRRTELGLSVDEVASRLGKNRATIYRYENNNIENLPTTVLEPLAKILNTTPAYLMGWEKEIYANISKELQISKEVLNIINRFSFTIDKNTEYSMMDIFNAIVTHKHFIEIINEMFIYISRPEDEWQKMTGYFYDSDIIKSINKDSIKAFCRSNITKKFEELILDVLSSNIDTLKMNNLTYIPKNSIANYNHKNTELAKEFFTDPNEARKYLETHQVAAFNGGKNLSDESIIQMANIAITNSKNYRREE